MSNESSDAGIVVALKGWAHSYFSTLWMKGRSHEIRYTTLRGGKFKFKRHFAVKEDAG